MASSVGKGERTPNLIVRRGLCEWAISCLRGCGEDPSLKERTSFGKEGPLGRASLLRLPASTPSTYRYQLCQKAWVLAKLEEVRFANHRLSVFNPPFLVKGLHQATKSFVIFGVIGVEDLLPGLHVLCRIRRELQWIWC